MQASAGEKVNVLRRSISIHVTGPQAEALTHSYERAPVYIAELVVTRIVTRDGSYFAEVYEFVQLRPCSFDCLATQIACPEYVRQRVPILAVVFMALYV